MSTLTTSSATSLLSTYVHLRDDRTAAPIENTPAFWRELTGGQRPELDAGRLLMAMDFTEDWPTWEIHPAGDEIVLLIAGEADLVLDLDGREERRPLRSPGDFVVVPRGVWHTAKISSYSKMLFITPGEGTENRPVSR